MLKQKRKTKGRVDTSEEHITNNIVYQPRSGRRTATHGRNEKVKIWKDEDK